MDESRAVREVRASGPEALRLSVELLRRRRLAAPTTGIWEPSDVQWWWRRPRDSDGVETPFWCDDAGPVAGVLVTGFGEERWQCDPVAVPGADGPSLETLLDLGLDLVAEHSAGVEVPVGGPADPLEALVLAAGLSPGPESSTGWLEAAAVPDRVPLPGGFVVVDRVVRAGTPHPMRARNLDTVGERLAATPSYDPWLDLSVEAPDGRTAAYALFWYDEITRVGLVEPVRVEEEFWRRGLARAMITEGLHRLVDRGAARLKIGWESEPASRLYQGLGFRAGLAGHVVGIVARMNEQIVKERLVADLCAVRESLIWKLDGLTTYAAHSPRPAPTCSAW